MSDLKPYLAAWGDTVVLKEDALDSSTPTRSSTWRATRPIPAEAPTSRSTLSSRVSGVTASGRNSAVETKSQRCSSRSRPLRATKRPSTSTCAVSPVFG